MKQIPFIAQIIFFWYKISTYSYVPRRVCRYSLGLSSFAKKSMWIHAVKSVWIHADHLQDFGNMCSDETNGETLSFLWVHTLHCTFRVNSHRLSVNSHKSCIFSVNILVNSHTVVVTSGSIIPVISLIWIVWIHSIEVEIKLSFLVNQITNHYPSGF